MNDSELKRALELYRTGNIDQVADLLHIEDVPTQIAQVSKTHANTQTQTKTQSQYKNNSTKQLQVDRAKHSQIAKTERPEPPKPTNSYNTMALDTTHPTVSKSVTLTTELVPFQPKLPNFFPAMLPESDIAQVAQAQATHAQATHTQATHAQATHTQATHAQATHTKPANKFQNHQSTPPANTIPAGQPKTVPSDEKVLGQNLPREIEAGMLKWLQIDDDLDKLRQIKRDLDEQKKALEDQIKSFMEKWEIPEIGPNQEVGLEFQVKEVKQGFTKKLVTDTLTKMFNNSECLKILEVMESQRNVTEKTCLKLKKPKKPKSRK